MSLINQVLKDIDQRGGTPTASSPLDGNVKSVAERVTTDASRGRIPVLFGGALVLVAAAAGGYWWWRGSSADTAVPAVVSAVAATGAAAGSTPVEPAATPTAPPVEQDPAVSAVAVEPAASAPPPASATAALASQALAGLAADWAKTLAGPEAARVTSEGNSSPPVPTGETAPLAIPQVKKTVTAAQASDSLYLRAERAFRERRPAEGQRLLRDALARNPRNHAAREWLATVLIELGRAAEAETWLAEGVTLAPDRRGFVLPLALLRQHAGNEAGALQLLESSIGSLADDAEAHAFLAALLQRQGRHTEATEHYVTALRQYPANARWLVGLGLSLQAQGMRQAAIEAFEAALASRSLEPGLETLATTQLLSARQGG